MHRLREAHSGRIVLERLEIADTFWKRLIGLQFRRSLPQGSGLLLRPCNSVHTFFVRFPIDIAFLDEQGHVLAVRRGVRPWRLVPPVKNAVAVLETAAGAAALDVDESVVVEPFPGVG